MTSYKKLMDINKQQVQRLVKYSGLDENLVRNIIKFSRCLCKPGYESIDSDMFSVVLTVYFNIVDQTALMKAYTRQTRKRPDGQMALMDFAEILCAFLTNDLDLKIDYVFKIYDITGDGVIDYNEVLQFMKSCKCVTDTDDADKDETYFDLSNFAASNLGISNHNVITLEDFRKRVKENTLLISVLGEALPSSGCVERFRQNLSGKTNLQMMETFGNLRYELLREIPDNTDKGFYPIRLDLPQ